MAAHTSLSRSLSDLDAQKALEQAKDRLRQGNDPQTILFECRKGIEGVGKRFETGEYFIADLIYAAHIFQKMMDLLGPELQKVMKPVIEGKILIVTVKNDIHDIGKNLVATMLNASGFEMIDQFVAHGHRAWVFFKNDQEQHLEFLQDLPKRKIVAHMESTDLAKAKKRLGGKICIAGGMSSVLLARGTPEEVRVTRYPF